LRRGAKTTPPRHPTQTPSRAHSMPSAVAAGKIFRVPTNFLKGVMVIANIELDARQRFNLANPTVLTLFDSALRQELGLDVVGILGAMSNDQSSNASLTSTYIELHSSVEMRADIFPSAQRVFSQFCSIMWVSAEDAPSSIIGDSENLCTTFANMGLAHFQFPSFTSLVNETCRGTVALATKFLFSRCLVFPLSCFLAVLHSRCPAFSLPCFSLV
jgi:hypothetical protein